MSATQDSLVACYSFVSFAPRLDVGCLSGVFCASLRLRDQEGAPKVRAVVLVVALAIATCGEERMGTMGQDAIVLQCMGAWGEGRIATRVVLCVIHRF